MHVKVQFHLPQDFMVDNTVFTFYFSYKLFILSIHYFQGFHILTDSTNAFAGLSSSCLEYLHDEYDRKSLLVFPVIPSHFPDNDFDSDEDKVKSLMNDSVRVLNLAFSFNEFNSYSNLFVPLSLGGMGWRQPGPKRQLQHVNYNVSFFLNIYFLLFR